MTRIGIAGVLAAIALAGCGGSGNSQAGSTSSAPSISPSGPPAAATVRLADFSLDPMSVSVKQGDSILVVNAGKSPHNLWLRDASGYVLVKTPNLKPGDQTTLKLDLPPGSYVDYCQEPGHESLGMKGALTVR